MVHNYTQTVHSAEPGNYSTTKKRTLKLLKRRITIEMINAMAYLAGFELCEKRLQELLPQLQKTIDGVEGLDNLDPNSIGPSVIFRPFEG